MITREQVAKQLFTSDMLPKGNKGGAQKRQPVRTTKPTKINLEKLNSQEFDALMTRVDTDLRNDELVKSKIEAAAAKKQVQHDIYTKVNQTSNINDDSESDSNSHDIQSNEWRSPMKYIGPKGPQKENLVKSTPKKNSNSRVLHQTADVSQNGCRSPNQLRTENKSPLKSPGNQTRAGKKTPSKSPSNQSCTGKKSPSKSPSNQNRTGKKSPYKSPNNRILSSPSHLINQDEGGSRNDILVSRGSQTEALTSECSCSGFWNKLENLIQQYKSAEPSQMNVSDLSFNDTPSKKKKVNEKGEVMVCLVKGCPQVEIPLSKKASIDIAVPNGDPSDLVTYLLEAIYTTEELAAMTCDGKTKGATRLPEDVADILMVYIDKKYNQKKFKFNKKLFKVFANKTFYTSRRSVWKHHPELVGKEIRAKM